ncbi:MAG: YbhB/YbcL family Raf kinase inhibitor-like protein [Caulobacteraceae bacterium]
MRSRLDRAAIPALIIAACSAVSAAGAGLAATSFPNARKMTVSCPAVGKNGRIDPRYGARGRNVSPPLRWMAVSGAKTYALLVEDPDAHGPRPFVHWLIWNIPGKTDALPTGVAKTPRPSDPPGAVQGRNGRGGLGYFGPSPPSGDPAHHYHFQVFALDSALPPGPASDAATLIGSMRGHVLATGECVGTFQTGAS